MNPPLYKASEDPKELKVYPSPLSREERAKQIQAVEELFKTGKPEMSVGSFSYLSPEYRRNRVKSDLTNYYEVLDSIIQNEGPDSANAQVAEIIKNDLETHFKKKIDQLDRTTQRVAKKESKPEETFREISEGVRVASPFVGKEIRKREIEEMISRSLEQIKDNAVDGDTASEEEKRQSEEDVNKIKSEFKNELASKLAEFDPVERNSPDAWKYHEENKIPKISEPKKADTPKVALPASTGTAVGDALLRAVKKGEEEGKDLTVKPVSEKKIEKDFSTLTPEEKIFQLGLSTERVKMLTSEEITTLLEVAEKVNRYEDKPAFDNELTRLRSRVRQLELGELEEEHRKKTFDKIREDLQKTRTPPTEEQELKMVQDLLKAVGDLEKEGVITKFPGTDKFFFNYITRRMILTKIGNRILPFYSSTSGASGKTINKWYPVFGIDKGDAWIKKGSRQELENGLEIPEVQALQNLINSKFSGIEVNEISDKYFDAGEKNEERLLNFLDSGIFPELRQLKLTDKESRREYVEKAIEILKTGTPIQTKPAAPATPDNGNLEVDKEKFYPWRVITIPDGGHKGTWEIFDVGNKGATLKKMLGDEKIEMGYDELGKYISDYESEASRKKAVLRPVTVETERARFKVGDRVRLKLAKSAEIVEAEIRNIAKNSRGVYAELVDKDGNKMEIKISRLRRLVEETKEIEARGAAPVSAPAAGPKPLAFDVDSKPLDAKLHPEFYLGRTLTIPDGKDKGVWSIASTGPRGATLKKIGSDRVEEIDYADLAKMFAEHEEIAGQKRLEKALKEYKPGDKLKIKNNDTGEIEDWTVSDIFLENIDGEMLPEIKLRRESTGEIVNFGGFSYFPNSFFQRVLRDGMSGFDKKQFEAPREKEKNKLSVPPMGQLISIFSQYREDPKALYEHYVDWERRWLINGAIESVREKKGTIPVSKEQIESTRKLLNAYKKILRLGAEGKPISQDTKTKIAGSVLWLAQILTGVHDKNGRYPLQGLVESYKPAGDAAALARLEDEIAEMERGTPIQAGPEAQQARGYVENLEDWVVTTRKAFNQIVWNNEGFKIHLEVGERNDFTKEENNIDRLIGNLEAFFAEVTATETQKKELRQKITDAEAQGQDAEGFREELDLLNNKKVLTSTAYDLAKEVHTAIVKYQEMIARKNKIVGARIKLQKEFKPGQSTKTREEIDEEERKRTAKTTKLLEEQHKIMSGQELLEGDAAGEGGRKMAKYLEVYTIRKEIPGTNEVHYYLREFDKNDPRGSIVRKMLKNEGVVRLILTKAEFFPNNEGKTVKLFFKEKGADAELRKEAEAEGARDTGPSMQGFAERYRPGEDREPVQLKQKIKKGKIEPPDTRNEEEKVRERTEGTINTGDVSYETSLNTRGMIRPVVEEARKLTQAERTARANAVEITLAARLKQLGSKFVGSLKGGDGLAYWALLGPLAVGYGMATASPTANGPETKLQNGTETTTAAAAAVPFTESLSPEERTFYEEELLTKSNKQIAGDAVKTDDPDYTTTFLNAPARPILYDAISEIVPGTLDSRGKDHRKEVSAILKKIQSIANKIRLQLQTTNANPALLAEATYLSEIPRETRKSEGPDDKVKLITVQQYLDMVRALALKAK
jgi:hypothetical protein